MEQTSDKPSMMELSGSLGRTSGRMTPGVEANVWGFPSTSEGYNKSSDISLFSSSLPVLHRKKSDLLESDPTLQSVDGDLPKLNELHKYVEDNNAIDDFDLKGIGNLLPDDEEELLAGIMDDFDLSGLPNQVEETEDYDVFGTGGIELDFDPTESLNVIMAKTNINGSNVSNVAGQFGVPHSAGTIYGEHPYGEHPSRTLFVRNINSNVEDSELRDLFEQYGDIRTLYTACKHRGFVMISYYDIRSARTAMRALQNKPLRRRKLDIHFSIPKDNPSDKDINQGTLVVFNLDPSVSNDELHQIFGAYGEVKEIRETPHKRHHKFVEFYDVRAAEAALRSLNRSDIAGKRIKLEPSRPGGARRNLMQQLSQELEQNEMRSYRHQLGSPMSNSPPGTWAQFGSPTDNNPLQVPGHSPTFGAINPVIANQPAGLASILPPPLSNSLGISPIGKDHSRISHGGKAFPATSSAHGINLQHPHPFSDSRGILSNNNRNAGTMSSLGQSTSGPPGIGSMAGSQFLWANPTPYTEHGHSSAWPVEKMRNSFTANGQNQTFTIPDCHGSLLGSSHNLIGSAPSGIPFESYFGHHTETLESSFMNSVSFGGMSNGRSGGHPMTGMGIQATSNPGAALSGGMVGSCSPNFRMMSTQRLSPMFPATSPYSSPILSGFEALMEQRSRRSENNATQLDSKKQYHLDLEKIISAEDTRTTLMIKNIPNKYTSKMLLAAIDENHKGTYDFFYLPIDFKNKCNVGYAFINMISPLHIVSFYKAFNGKKWEKFNSEKVASLAYGRIQGRTALVAHFQNSSLMNEDKRCHPILFHSEGPEAGNQEPFPLCNANFRVCHVDGIPKGDSLEVTAETNPSEVDDKNKNALQER